MHWDEHEAAAKAPTTPTVKQVVAPSATEATLPEAAITVRPTSECPGFLLILLRALSAPWGT